jgi:hypothetical protein
LDELFLDAQHRGLLSSTPAVEPNCAGNAGSVAGVEGSVTVGLLGAKDALGSVQRQLTSAEVFPFMLPSGREGVAFRPPNERSDAFAAFLRRAASGEFPGVDVVLLRQSPRQN